jgi:hypothetical protein
MPSIGLALHAGRQMWESERKEKETNDRFLAERKLFEAQLKEQEAAAEYLNQANEQARSAKKSILNNRERILIGDPTGTANVLRDTVYRDFDGKVTVDPDTKEVVIIDRDGKEVGRQQPLMGMDGVAKLMQLGNTIDQTYAANVAAQQLAQQRAYEMTKMREEKGFDYKKAVDVENIKSNATLGAASIGANATLGSTAMRADSDKYKANLDFQKALHVSTLENLDKIERAKWVQANAAASGLAPTLDSATNNLMLAPLSPEQAAKALNYYSGMTSLSGKYGPGMMPSHVYTDEVLRGRSDSALNTQRMFDYETQMPLGVPSLTFNTGLSGVQGNPYNNFGFNFGGQQLGAVQQTLDKQAQDAAAAEAARQTRALERARAYGFIR